jgi:hypothetical protein
MDKYRLFIGCLVGGMVGWLIAARLNHFRDPFFVQCLAITASMTVGVIVCDGFAPLKVVVATLSAFFGSSVSMILISGATNLSYYYRLTLISTNLWKYFEHITISAVGAFLACYITTFIASRE